jgi:hypothetical protein
MSFRKYGGTNKLEKNNNLTVHSIVADTFTIRDAFLSVFTIDGNLKINGNAVISDILTVKEQINVKTLDVSSNATIEGYLYLDKLQDVFLKGNDKMIGINTDTASATLDISSNKVQAFGVKTSNVNNRNIIARNASNNGVAVVATGTTESGIQFYSAATGTIDVSNAQGAIIKYSNTNGILTIDASGSINVKSKMIISDNTSTGTTHTAFGETLLLHDKNTGSNPIFFNESYGNASVKTGTALTIKSIDNASNTFMNIVSPDNNLGIQIGGGSFPKDPTRSMGIIDVYHEGTDTTTTPAMMIISGNTFTKYNSTTGFNTFAPKYNDYAVDINGPLHLNNGEIKKTADVTFRVAKMGSFGSLYGMAIGAQGTDNNPLTHYPFVTTNGGKNWVKINTFFSSTTTTLIPGNVIFKTIHCYSPTRTIVSGTQNIDPQNFAYVLDVDVWSKLTIEMVQVNAIYASDVSKNFIYSGGKSDNYGNAIIRGGSIYPYNSSGPQYAYSDRDPSFNYPMLDTTISSMAGYGRNLIVVGGNKLHKFDMGAGKMSLVTPPTTTTDSVGNVYLSVRLADANNGVAVGGNIISYTRNGGVSWSPANIPSMAGKRFNDVYLDNSMNAIVVGNGGYIYSSNDNYTTWKRVSEDVLNASGIGARITDETNDITSVFMTDSSTIILSIVKNNTPDDKTSKLYYLNMPNIFNNKQNFLFDISGCVRMSGDMYINDGGNLISNNQTFNLLTTNVTTLNVGTSALALNLGGVNSTTINVGGLNTTNLTMGGLNTTNLTMGGLNTTNLTMGGLKTTSLTMGGANITIGGTSSGNVLIGGRNTANVFIGGANTGNIIIGGSGSGSIFGSLNVSALSIGNVVTLANNLNTGNIYANSIVVTNNLDVSNGILTINTTNNSTSATTGSLVVYGGLGVVKDIYSSGNINSLSDINLSGNMYSTGKKLVITSNDDITASVSGVTINYTTSTGTMQIVGGTSISKNLYVGGTSYLGGNVVIQGTITYLGGNVTTSTTFSSAIVASPLRGNSSSNVDYNYTLIPSVPYSNEYNQIGFGSGAITTEGGLAVALDSWLIGNLRVDGGNTIIGNVLNYVESINSTTGAVKITGGVGIRGNTNIGGNVIIYSSIESISATTGALQIIGGVGIRGNTNIGGNVIIYSSIESISATTGALQIIGGVGIGGNTNIGGNVVIYSSIESISATTGALQIRGGIGIGGNTNIGGNVIIYSSIESISATTGALQIRGGVGIGGNTNIGGNVIIYSSIESISATTGALQIRGGVGIGGNTNIGGNVIIYSSIESISATTGALQIRGGIGIGGNVYITRDTNIGGNVIINSSIESISATTGALQIIGGVGIRGNTNIGGNVIIYSSIESTSANTGALQIIGGVGIRGNTNIGGNVIIYSSIESISATTGALQIIGGVGIRGNTNIGGNVIIYSSIESISATTGALQIIGGVGIRGNTNIGGNVVIYSSIESISATTGALQIRGGVGIGGNIYITRNTNIGGSMIVNDLTDAISVTSGALQVKGGIGVNGNIISNSALYSATAIVSGALRASDLRLSTSTVSTGPNIGALVLELGGLGLAGSIHAGGNVIIYSSIPSSSAATGALQVRGGLGIGGDINGSSTTVVTVNSITTNFLTANRPITINDTEESFSLLTGALKISNGGLAVKGNTNIGGNVVIYSSIPSSSTATGALQVRGGLGIGGDINGSSTTVVTVNSIYTNFLTLSSGGLIINSSEESSSLTTGALKVSNGGLAVNGNTNLGGNVFIHCSLQSSSSTTGALRVRGGVGIEKKLYVGETLNVVGASTIAVTTITGGLVVTGGSLNVGAAASLGGTLNVVGASTLAVTTITGGLVVTGGSLNVGAAASLGGTLNVVGASTLAVTTITGGLVVTGGSLNVGTGTTLGGILNVVGASRLAVTTITGGLVVTSGSITATNQIVTCGAITTTGQLTATNQIVACGTLTASTAASITGTLNVTTNASIGGTLLVTGSLYVGPNDGALSTPRSIFFGGVAGDQDYNMAVIESRIYGVTDQSELLLYKGNDPSDDRIRLKAGSIRFDTDTGTASDRITENTRMIILSNGNVGIGTLNPSSIFHVNGTITSGAITTQNNNITCGTGTISCAAITASGDISNSPSWSVLTGRLVVATSGATISGGLVVASGGASVTGGVLVANSGVSATSGGMTCTGALSVSGGITISSGGITATGQAISCGSLTASGEITATGGIVGNLHGNIKLITDSIGTPSTRNPAPSYQPGRTVGFGFGELNNSTYCDYIHFNTWSEGGGGNQNLLAVKKNLYGMRIYQAGFGSTSVYSDFREVVLRDVTGTGTITATTFNATSDKRIKANITDISGSSLDILRKINPKEFTFIDTKEPRYGFIAQEVRQHIPRSVKLTTDYIPSVYENAFVKGNTITLINKSTTDISNCKLKLRDISNGEIIVNVAHIKDNKTFTINQDISQNKLQYMDIYGNNLDKQINNGKVVYKRGSEIYTGEVKQGLFVYGIEVNDFHSINHDTIWTVAVGATKEMDVQLQEARQTIKSLEERISAIERLLLRSGAGNLRF